MRSQQPGEDKQEPCTKETQQQAALAQGQREANKKIQKQAGKVPAKKIATKQ